MKIKLNILLAAICAIILFNIGKSLNIAAAGFMAGSEAFQEDEKKFHGDAQHLSDLKTIDIIPQSVAPGIGIDVDNSVSGKTQKIYPMTIGIISDTETNNMAEMALGALVGLLVVGVSIVLLWQFILFIYNIYKGQVFVSQNVKHLRILGIGILVMGVISTVESLISTATVAKTFAVKGYDICFSSAVAVDALFFGVFILIVAEAFAIGLKNQKEVDLTI